MGWHGVVLIAGLGVINIQAYFQERVDKHA